MFQNETVTAINSNKVVEMKFGEIGMLCIEDIVSEIFKQGNNAEKIIDGLSTFKLNKPTDGYGNKF